MALYFYAVLFLAFVFDFGPANSGYVVTTPRRWTINAQSQICAFLTAGSFSSKDSVAYKLTEANQKAVLTPSTEIRFPEGKTHGCVNVPVPLTPDGQVTLALTGTLVGEPINDVANLTFVAGSGRTFIQTDKYLYKPGQEVQFRILSVTDPNITVVTDSYEEVFVNNPSRTRIAQWNDVDNSGGLVHLSFNLFDEIEEGIYTIGAKLPDQPTEEKIFRVEDFVLPRFEVTIEAPKNIFGSDENVTVNLCAKYTFGEPVKGNATLYLATGSWKVYANLTESKQITGCESFTFSAKDLLFDYNNCHISVNNLKANAKVIEDGTGVELYGENNFIQVHRRAVQYRDQSPTGIKKPYLPSLIEVAAFFPDNTPAKNETLEACTYYESEKFCKNFTTNNKGVLNFVMPSHISSTVEIRAVNYPKLERNFNDVMEESIFYKNTYYYEEYVDATNSSLTIYVGKKIMCTTGEEIIFNVPVVYIVRDEIHSADINVQVASRGQVLLTTNMTVQFVGSEIPMKKEDQLLPLESVPAGIVMGVFEIPLTLTEQSSPKISVLVWFSTSDGGVVADSHEIDISDCLSHKVTFEWSEPKVEPGKQANLIINGANNSLCSIGVVDKSVELLSSENNKLDIQSILQITYNSEVAQYDSNQLTLEYCLRKYNSSSSTSDPESSNATEAPAMSGAFKFASMPFYNRYSMKEALHMFNSAGYYVFSNLILEKKFCDELIIEDMKNKASSLLTPQISDDRIAINTKLFSSPMPASGGFGGGFGGGGAAPEMAVAFAPQSFDSDMPANKEGEVESAQERSYLPETWLWLLKPLSASGVLNEAMTLPDTITEWVGSAVCVHPTEGVGISSSASIVTFTSFFVDLTLPSSAKRGEILPITISIFNYLEEDLPVKVVVVRENFTFTEGETGMREICVPSKAKSVETVKVLLTTIGDLNITIEASTQPLSSGTCGSGTPPTKKDRFIRSFPVEPEGFPREKTWTNYICSQDLENAEGPAENWVIKAPDAIVEGSERGYITAIGDLMGPTVENLGYLVRLPSGCGEQNMINFAPNIYILQYLDASNQTTPLIKSKITKFLNQGYQRQLLFRHSKDGSYSAFGESDKEGSTWLTAFVVKSFGQARPYTQIDEKTLLQSADWLKGLQFKDGCFEPSGRVINKMLQGGITGDQGSEGLLTAYVLAAILEEGNVTSEIINAAVQCIENNTSVHPYSLALKSYSLALAKAPNAKAVIDQLISLSASNSSFMRWDLPDRTGENTALHVETAAYALLGIVTFNPALYKEEARKIVRWLSSQRNGQGGFISTQDTVVALQALAAFEKSQPRESLNMDIKVGSTTLNHAFKVTDENKFLEQRVDIPKFPATVDITIGGNGCALVQGVLRYNVLAESASKAFTLQVNTSRTSELECKTQNISACTSYTLSDGVSNMAILQFKLLSGYIPIKQDLKDIVGDGKGIFKKYEVDGLKVTFYLEEVTSTPVCANIRVQQEVEIGNAKPGSVTVFDYYQPEFTIEQKFSLSNCSSSV